MSVAHKSWTYYIVVTEGGEFSYQTGFVVTTSGAIRSREAILAVHEAVKARGKFGWSQIEKVLTTLNLLEPGDEDTHFKVIDVDQVFTPSR